MQCPICKIWLLMMDKQWIEIDYCPQCRWVWLDRWELEKIIELNSKLYSDNNFKSDTYESKNKDQQQYYKQDKEYNEWKYNKHNKKESFLSDLFDF